MMNFFHSIRQFFSEFRFKSSDKYIAPGKPAWFMNNIIYVAMFPVCVYSIIVNPMQIYESDFFAGLLRFLLFLSPAFVLAFPLFCGNHILIFEDKIIDVSLVVRRTSIQISDITNVVYAPIANTFKIFYADDKTWVINAFLYSDKNMRMLAEKLGFPCKKENKRKTKGVHKGNKNKDSLYYWFSVITSCLIYMNCLFIIVTPLLFTVRTKLGIETDSLNRIVGYGVLILGFRRSAFIEKKFRKKPLKKLVWFMITMLITIPISVMVSTNIIQLLKHVFEV